MPCFIPLDILLLVAVRFTIKAMQYQFLTEINMLFLIQICFILKNLSFFRKYRNYRTNALKRGHYRTISRNIGNIGFIGRLRSLPMNNPFYSPPNTHHNLLWVKVIFGRCYTWLSSSQPLSLTHVVNIQHSFVIAGNKIAEPLVVVVRCH